jgi:hypothetical protein
MRISRRVVTKTVIALLVGIPGTVLYLPLVLFVVYLGGLSAADQLYGPLEIAKSGLLVLWGLAGFLGLAGFWYWVFLRPDTSRRRRLVAAACVFAGVCAVVPLLLGASWVYAGVAAAGCLVGIVVCLWLVLPNLPLNPDARQEQPRAG